METPSRIRIGTSGWNYPTGQGTWNGIFYPPRRYRGFDELAYYAEHFDTVEVNSTFYRMPEPPLSRKWVERTPPAFLFSIKLFQKFTHPDMYLARAGVTEWDLSRADIDLFRFGVEPIAAADRLTAVLLQFPPSFHSEPATADYLTWLLDALHGYPLAVELRHRSWIDAAADTRARLDAHQAAWALVDSPETTSEIISGASRGNDLGGLSYVRLHGRNAANWWSPKESEDRYNYLYSPTELAPFADAARRAAKTGKKVAMYMNNHFSAKAVANAAILKQQLDQPLPGDYPAEMLRRYPNLKGLVRTSDLLID